MHITCTQILQQHTEQVRAAAKEMYEHAVDLVHSAKASEQEAMAKAASEIEAKLKKADMARAAHLDEMKEKATRQVCADSAFTHCAERTRNGRQGGARGVVGQVG